MKMIKEGKRGGKKLRSKGWERQKWEKERKEQEKVEEKEKL